MILDHSACYEALQSHDPRFDGVFFVGVCTTGIYCRTVCTARLPLRKNCTFYESAAAAERAGYRPCLRCRPELAPGTTRRQARIGAAIAARIEGGDMADRSITALAAEMGLSERQLRRIVHAEFGVSPVELAQTQRLHTAKRLLTDTDLPIGQTAYASGFSSLRRFNALFRERYRLNPTQLRKRKEDPGESPAVKCSLAYRPPMDWRGMLQFLSLRAIPGVETVTELGYSRTVRIGPNRGWISVTNHPAKNCLIVEVSHSLVSVIRRVLQRTRHLFDLDADPLLISAHLGDLAAANPGARVPGAWDGFEMTVRAICGQQVTVRGATTLSGRIARTFGEPFDACPIDGLTHFWPDAGVVATLSREDLAACGFIRRRADTILALASADVPALEPCLNVEHAIRQLTAIPGIGDWTAQYVAMRALGWPDAFPASDLGIMKALSVTNPSTAAALAEPWRPWRSYAAIHLWRRLENLK